MQKMQLIQPEIKKLQAKYKDNRQQLNEEIMKFYKENQVNPMAGCLPLFLQMPIFFALFRVLREPLKHIPTSPSSSTVLRQLQREGLRQDGGLPKGLVPRPEPVQERSRHQGRVRHRPSVLPADRPGGRDRLPAVQADAVPPDEAPANPQAAMMGKVFPGPVRLHLLPVAERGGAVLPREQRVADRAAGDHFPLGPRPAWWARAEGAIPASGSAPKPKTEAPQPVQPPAEGRFKKALGQAREAARGPAQPRPRARRRPTATVRPSRSRNGHRRPAAPGPRATGGWDGPNHRARNPGRRSVPLVDRGSTTNGMDRHNREDRGRGGGSRPR